MVITALDSAVKPRNESNKPTGTAMHTNDGLLKVTGQDAKKLLQGQLTCNVDEVTATNDCLGAHCNPQGRVISLFRLFQHNDAYYLHMSKSLIPIALTALKKYAVFYKVELSDATNELDTLRTAIQIEPYASIQKGIPAIYPETSGKFLPHDLNLPDLHAVNFDKGCYTGQEIIARMQYRGTPKNHLYSAEITTTKSPIPGEDIYCDDQQIVGSVVDVSTTTNNVYQTLIVTSASHAKDNHLFLKSNTNKYFTIKNNQTREPS